MKHALLLLTLVSAITCTQPPEDGGVLTVRQPLLSPIPFGLEACPFDQIPRYGSVHYFMNNGDCYKLYIFGQGGWWQVNDLGVMATSSYHITHSSQALHYQYGIAAFDALINQCADGWPGNASWCDIRRYGYATYQAIGFSSPPAPQTYPKSLWVQSPQ